MSLPIASHPLAGKRIVITRPEAQSHEFAALLREVGAVPILFPTIATQSIPDNAALDQALRHLGDYDWIVFTSVNGVKLTLERMAQLGIPTSALAARRIAAIGPITAGALQSRGITVELQPAEYIAEAIVSALVAQQESLNGKRFLLLRADIARETLNQQLTAFNAQVEEIPVYHTVTGTPDPAAYAAIRAGVDIITFTSSSTLRYFFKLLGEEANAIARSAVIACIGPITAQTARDFGLNVAVQAETFTIDGLMAALTSRVDKD